MLQRISLAAVWMLVSLCWPRLLQAQNEPFKGGSGGGDNNMVAALTNCSVFRYAGGAGLGNTSEPVALTNCTAYRFLGGGGDGDSSSTSPAGTCAAFRFTGGNGDGDSSIASALTSCNLFRFAGDTSSGFGAAQSALTSCNLFRFAGDSGAGYKAGVFLKPRNFLGNDTSITIICSEERFNLLSLYHFEGITIGWNTSRPDSAFTGSFRAIGTTTGGCVDTAFALIKQEIAIWNGSVSNNWHTAANWSNNKVPNESTHVIIPGATPNPCIISSANATAVSVQGKLNGNFSITNNRNLLISGRCVQLPPP